MAKNQVHHNILLMALLGGFLTLALANDSLIEETKEAMTLQSRTLEGGKNISLDDARRAVRLTARLKELDRLIEEAVGDPIATELSRCRLVPTHLEPCAGPARYVVFSSQAANVYLLEELSSERRKVSETINEIVGASGYCMMIRLPKIILVDGRCRTG